MGQGAGPCPGLLAFPHTSAPSKATVEEGKRPWGDARPQGCSPQAGPRGCWSNMFHWPGAFSGEQLSCTNSPEESQCRPLPCPLTHLPPPPECLQQPRTPRALCLLLIYLSCKDEPRAFHLSALPAPSREEVMEDLAGDAHACQPRGTPDHLWRPPRQEPLAPGRGPHQC